MSTGKELMGRAHNLYRSMQHHVMIKNDPGDVAGHMVHGKSPSEVDEKAIKQHYEDNDPERDYIDSREAKELYRFDRRTGHAKASWDI